MQASIFNKSYPELLHRIVYLTFLLFFAGAFASCKDENEEKDNIHLNTNKATSFNNLGALVSAEIISGDLSTITEYGFAWSTDENPDAGKADKQYKTGAPSGPTFSDTIRWTLKLNETYYLRAYVKSGNHLAYGNTVSFKSLGSMAPIITGFTPKSGTWGDTIRITGQHFGYNTKALQVNLGNAMATVVASTNESIDMVIPPDQFSEKVSITVSVNGNHATSATNFTFLLPTVSSISPLTGIFDDTLTVVGANFSRLQLVPHIYFNDYPARTIFASREMLKVVVPRQLTDKTSPIIIIGPASRRAFYSFTLKGIELISFTPDTIFTGNEILTLNVRNLSPLPDNNLVLINGTRATITYFSTTMLKVSLPSNIIPDKLVSSVTSVPIKVVRGQEELTFPVPLVVNWKSK